jgi:MFS family permease
LNIDQGFNKKMITLGINGAFFMIGIALTVFGPTITYLMHDYRINMGTAGLFVTAMAFGRMLSVIVSGVIADHFGKKLILTMGTVLITFGLIGIGSLSWFWIAFIIAFIIGIGHGMIDVAGVAALSDIYPSKLNSTVARSHMYFGFGCLAGPLIAGIILTYELSWRVVFYFDGFIGLIFTILLIAQSFPEPDKKIGRKKNAVVQVKSLFNSGTLLMVLMIAFLYSGVGHSINTWINKYMGDVIRLSTFFAAGSLAIYNLGITMGRMACSFAAEKIESRRILMIGAAGGLFSIIFVLFSHWGIIIIMGLGLTGFFFGGLLPTSVAIAGQMYPERTGTMTGVIMMMGALGSMTIPAATGVVSQWIGLENSLKALTGLVVILTLISLGLQERKSIYREEDQCIGIKKQ